MTLPIVWLTLFGHGWRLRRLICKRKGHVPDYRPSGDIWCQRKCGYVE